MKAEQVVTALGALAQDTRLGIYRLLVQQGPASGPSVIKPEYAKWMLEDPKVNFAISSRGRAQGIDHLGIPPATCCETDLANRDTQISSPV